MQFCSDAASQPVVCTNRLFFFIFKVPNEPNFKSVVRVVSAEKIQNILAFNKVKFSDTCNIGFYSHNKYCVYEGLLI